MPGRRLLGILLLLVLAAPAIPPGAAAEVPDAEAPTFGAPLPDGGEWITSSPALVAIQVFDNGSGVERVEYSTEYDGAPFVRWNEAALEPGARPGEWSAHALVALPEGNLSNIVWRAWDRAGNGPAESPIVHLRVDTQELSFFDPYPDPARWVDDANVTPAVWIHAGQGGLNRSTLEYRISSGGLFGFGPWVDKCPPPPPLPPPGNFTVCIMMLRRDPDGTVDESLGIGYSVNNMSYAEGDQNWVQWRASNDAGGRLYVSDPYRVRFDSKPPVIVSVEPGEDRILPLAPIHLVVEAHEGSPQEVAQRGLNLTAGSARYRVLGPNDNDFGPWLPLALDTSSGDGWSATWGATLDLERQTSVVEMQVSEVDGSSTVARTRVHVNEDPFVTLVSDPPGFTVEANGTLRITAHVTDDGGGPLTLAWSPCGGEVVGRNVSLEVGPGTPGAGTGEVGDIALCFQANDTMDGATRVHVTVHVVAAGSLPPPAAGGPGGPAPPEPLAAGVDLWWLALLLAGASAGLFLLQRRAGGR